MLLRNQGAAQSRPERGQGGRRVWGSLREQGGVLRLGVAE